jgi:hypothetical protein
MLGTILVGLTTIALVAMLGVHVALLVRLATRAPRYRALVALAVPPLAPYWGWRTGARTWVYVWGGALALYTLGVAVLLR